jgi:c(7)-type cytochrome triheme protein
MRLLLPLLALLTLILGSGFGAEEKKPPAKMTFESKMGNVTFDHAAHIRREKNECKNCHPSVFKQDAKAPLNFKPAMHKPAENAHISCGFCHAIGRKAFPSAGNCAKCHLKAAS